MSDMKVEKEQWAELMKDFPRILHPVRPQTCQPQVFPCHGKLLVQGLPLVSAMRAMRRGVFVFAVLVLGWLNRCWVSPSRNRSLVQRGAAPALADRTVEDLRWSLLRMAAALDRGQVSGDLQRNFFTVWGVNGSAKVEIWHTKWG